MDIAEHYLSLVENMMDEDGFKIPYGLELTKDGKVSVYALALSPAEAYEMMLSVHILNDPAEMIFALDRYGKAEQGTTMPDLLAGHCYSREDGWKPFIIEYSFSPKVVMPINWDNIWWNRSLAGELHGARRVILDRVMNQRKDS
jgi:hypothetical protein